MVHRVETLKPMQVPYVLINLAEEGVSLSKGEVLGNLELVKEDIEENGYRYCYGNDECGNRRRPKYLRWES